MNLRTLEYVCAVADFGHFGKAAAHCGVSQPALSGQIRKFEAQLGVPIFERTPKEARLTDAGRAIVSLSRSARQTIEEMSAVAKAAQDPLSGTLRIGLIPTVAPYLIPLMSDRLADALPKVTIRYCEGITDRLNDSLQNGELDTAVMSASDELSDFERIDLYAEPFWLAAHESHPLNRKKTLRAKDLATRELMLLTEGHCFREQALEICGMTYRNEASAVWATGIETLVNMVAINQGITLVPALAVPEGGQNDRGVAYRKLSDVKAFRKICLAFRKTFLPREQIRIVADTIRQSVPAEVCEIYRD